MPRSIELPKTWDQTKEADLYKRWEEASAFAPPPTGSPFCIIMPPTNANGVLHAGHALGYTLQDLMTRYRRMLGQAALWLPGADHAGFETQVVFEKKLEKEGKSRFDFERQEFYQAVYDFSMTNKTTMEGQGEELGISCDWSRNMFTLDPRIVAIVYKTFKKLFDDGLVYRADRLVNYCVKHGTAFSDLEVDHEEQGASLWYIKYPLKDSSNFITVATTRPETMLGDTAVAVNPEDPRYKDLVGRSVILPLTGREIPIIADDFVDPEFGTGAVKVTPAHDPNDFAAAERHHLERIQVIDTRGRMTDKVPEKYRGQKTKAARELVIADMDALGLLQETKPYTHSVGVCYKCRNIIEPLPMPQWYVGVDELKKPAIKAIESGQITFTPERFKTTALTWLNNFEDWNISRQIWWGIPIPAFNCPKHPDNWVVTEDGQPPAAGCQECGAALVQDPDTFDTWFSSGQWPFATLQALGGDNFARFYPTSVMETMYDIIPWWVCRMIMMGLYVTGDVPFNSVYIHGMVKDAKGQKMSKSKGNVTNPLDLAHKYGADALRFSYIIGNPPGSDMPLIEDKVRSYRNFANKIWNAARFVLMNVEGEQADIRRAPEAKAKAQTEMLKTLAETQKTVTDYLNKSQFHLAAETLYEFFWHQYCDVYLEQAKAELAGADKAAAEAVLLHVLAESLVMLHPMMPFVTEAIWQHLRQVDSSLPKLLITTPWHSAK